MIQTDKSKNYQNKGALEITYGDVYVNCMLVIAFLASPFMTVGRMGNPCVYYISLAVSILSLIIVFGRGFYCFKRNKYVKSSLLPYFMRDCSLPYATTLSALIMHPDGKNCEMALWFSLGLFIIVSVIYVFVAFRKFKMTRLHPN